MSQKGITEHIDILGACERLERAGLIAGTSGNVSTRSQEVIVTTPTTRIKQTLREEELVHLKLSDLSPARAGQLAPSSEVRVHAEIYRQVPWARAVVHAHPVEVSALLATGRPLNFCVTAEGAALGPIARVPYIRPGTQALAETCARGVTQGARALLLEQHGAVCVGETLDEALARMEALEHVARILRAAWVMGEPSYLTPREVRALREAMGFDKALPPGVMRLKEA